MIILNALLLATGLSLLSGLVAYGLVRAAQSKLGRHDVLAWRMARLVVILPFLLAPVIAFTPERIEPSVAPMAHGEHDPQEPAEYIDRGVTFEAGWRWSRVDWRYPAAGLFLLGLAGAGLLALRRHAWRERIVSTSRLAQPFERQRLEQIAEHVGIWSPELRISPALTSPCISGWRPVVLVPQSLLGNLHALRLTLTHELVHLRRGDERDRLIGAALKLVLWFHLPLHWIESALDEARERACDAEALDILGPRERKSYASTLILMMQAGARPVSAFGPDRRAERERRIRAILNQSSARRWAIPALLAGGAALLVPVSLAQAAWTERANVWSPLVLLEDEAPREPRADRGDVSEADARAEREARANRDTRAESEARASRNARSENRPEGALLVSGDNILVEPRALSGDQPRVEPARPQSPAPVAQPAPDVSRETAPQPAPVSTPEPAPAPARQSAPEPAPVPRSEPPAVPERAPDLSAAITDGRITSSYGPRPSRPADAPVFHSGCDIAAPEGTLIFAAGGGLVTHAEMGLNGNNRWGNTVVIDHGEGWETVYAHMKDFKVEAGDAVEAGGKIGHVGNTGASTGPHVHVEVRYRGQRLDPSDYLTYSRC